MSREGAGGLRPEGVEQRRVKPSRERDGGIKGQLNEGRKKTNCLQTDRQTESLVEEIRLKKNFSWDISSKEGVSSTPRPLKNTTFIRTLIQYYSFLKNEYTYILSKKINSLLDSIIVSDVEVYSLWSALYPDPKSTLHGVEKA